MGPLAGRPRLLQGAHARDRCHLRRRGLRPLLLPRVLVRGLGDAARAAPARAALLGRPLARRGDVRVPLPLFHLRGDQLRGRGSRGEGGGDRAALLRRGGQPHRRGLGRLPGLALQHPALEHRAPAPAQPRVTGLPGAHGAAPRRGPGADPLMSAETAPPVSPEAALERVAEAGIHTLRIPTPFAVGRVNCYLLEDDPLTLVDTGPNSGKALDELQAQLAERGHAIADIELVILTHQHIDHLGLVEIIVQHSGAEVAAIDAAVERLANFGEDAEREDQFAADLMLRNGIPENVVFALQSVSRSFRGWGARARVTRPLADGERMSFRDRSLEVMHRPGHSPSDTVFWDEERRILLAA